jgi:hypothetical protein
MARTPPPSATVPAEDTAIFGYPVMRKKLGGISQSMAELLVKFGPDHGGIDSITVGVPGSKRPRRMFTDEHIAEYIERRTAKRVGS